MSDRLRDQIQVELVRLIGKGDFGLQDIPLWVTLAGSLRGAGPVTDEALAAASQLGIARARRSSEIGELVEEFMIVRGLMEQAAAQTSVGQSQQFLVEANEKLVRVFSLAITSFHDLRLQEARRDPITRLPDRAAFEESLTEEVERAERYQRPFALVIFDIDNFKNINDEQGHPAGDRILAEVGAVISRSLRRTDQVFRYGGDEFAAVCLEIDEAAMKRVLARVESALGKVRISSGVAYFPSEAEDRIALVSLADERLYQCKRSHHQPT